MLFIIICFILAVLLIASIIRDEYKERKRFNDTFKRNEDFLKK